MSRSNIWINLTTSYLWNRPPVGIVRVEQSLSKELKKIYGDNLRFCIWKGNKFEEIKETELSFFQSNVKTEVAKSNTGNLKKQLPLLFPLLSKKQALMAIAQGVMSLVPNRFRPICNKFLYKTKPWAGRFFQFAKRMYRKRISTKGSYSNDRVFLKDIHLGCLSSSDILISLGLDWDYDFYKHFYFYKKHYDIKIITCCYDLIPVMYPQYCVSNVASVFTSYFIDVAESSSTIFCISECTERDLKSLLHRTGACDAPTQVFRLGDQIAESSTESSVSDETLAIAEKPFILFVSSVERRKNHEVLYRAFHLLCKQGKKSELPQLVFVGMPGWGVGDLLKDISLDPETEGLISILNHVSDADLNYLYEKAKFCVFPSFYEGWGLPVGEALAKGKAIICSSTGSLPEVGGRYVLYADPWSPSEWAKCIYMLTSDPEYLRKIEADVISGYKPYQWNASALSFSTVIDKYLS